MGLPMWRAPSPPAPRDAIKKDSTATARSPIRRRHRAARPPRPAARSDDRDSPELEFDFSALDSETLEGFSLDAHLGGLQAPAESTQNPEEQSRLDAAYREASNHSLIERQVARRAALAGNDEGRRGPSNAHRSRPSQSDDGNRSRDADILENFDFTATLEPDPSISNPTEVARRINASSSRAFAPSTSNPTPPTEARRRGMNVRRSAPLRERGATSRHEPRRTHQSQSTRSENQTGRSTYSPTRHREAQRQPRMDGARVRAMLDGEELVPDFPPLRRMPGRRNLDGTLPSSSLRESWGPGSTVDGLGDRQRSISPPDQDHWEVMHTTITPDLSLPSADSSFTSAAASASFSAPTSNSTSQLVSNTSRSGSAASSRTHITVPSRRQSPNILSATNPSFTLYAHCETDDDNDNDDNEHGSAETDQEIRARRRLLSQVHTTVPHPPATTDSSTYRNTRPNVRLLTRDARRLLDRYHSRLEDLRATEVAAPDAERSSSNGPVSRPMTDETLAGFLVVGSFPRDQHDGDEGRQHEGRSGNGAGAIGESQTRTRESSSDQDGAGAEAEADIIDDYGIPASVLAPAPVSAPVPVFTQNRNHSPSPSPSPSPPLDLDPELEAMRDIVELLARRDDVPEEFWTSAGLGRLGRRGGDAIAVRDGWVVSVDGLVP